MKKTFFAMLIACWQLNLFAQCNNFYVKTPHNNDVKACSSGGYSPSQVLSADAYSRTFAVTSGYVFEGGTNDYNCHGYCWNVKEGGSKVWINNVGLEANNLNTYWNDYSYRLYSYSASNHLDNLKVFYPSTDHSAVTTPTYGIFNSKMGCGCLVGHYSNNSPYGNSFVYYAPLFFDGPDLVPCSGSVSYTLPGSPSNISWSASSLSLIGNNTLNTVTFSKMSNNTIQSDRIYVSCKYNGVSRNISKDVEIGVPRIISITPNTYNISAGGYITFSTVPSISSPAAYDWLVTPSSGVYHFPWSNDITFWYSGTYNVSVRSYINSPPCVIVPTTYKSVVVYVN